MVNILSKHTLFCQFETKQINKFSIKYDLQNTNILLTGWQLVSKETFITLVVITDGMKQVLLKNNTISNNAIEEILRMFTISWIHMNLSLRSTASQKKKKTWKTVFYDPVISNPPWGISFHHDHNSSLIQRGFFFFFFSFTISLSAAEKKKKKKKPSQACNQSSKALSILWFWNLLYFWCKS